MELKNRHGQWLCWMSPRKKNGLQIERCKFRGHKTTPQQILLVQLVDMQYVRSRKCNPHVIILDSAVVTLYMWTIARYHWNKRCTLAAGKRWNNNINSNKQQQWLLLDMYRCGIHVIVRPPCLARVTNDYLPTRQYTQGKRKYRGFETLILSGPESRFGDKLLRIWVVCPQNGTVVLKHLGRIICDLLQ